MRRRLTLALLLFLISVIGHSQTPTERATLAAKALQQWYVPRTGLYRTTGWWNAGNAITTLSDLMRATRSRTYVKILSTTFTNAQKPVPAAKQKVDGHEMTGFPGFLNKYYDDEGWWALAWINAYDLTHDPRYLAAAQSIFKDMTTGWDETCNGGIWWSKDRKYKNAIANELFLSVAAHLANRANAEGRQQYLDWSSKEWSWFQQSGMINTDNLINDGLTIDKTTGRCTNNKGKVWTYNQGVILGGLAELSKSPNPSDGAALLETANRIAKAALTHLADPEGILHDPCEPKCGADGIQFKGIFLRNLRYLHNVAPDPAYTQTFTANANALWTTARTPQNTFGTVWSAPPTAADAPDAGTQSSALDALVAAIPTKP